MIKVVVLAKRAGTWTVDDLRARAVSRHGAVVAELTAAQRHVPSLALPGGYRRGEPVYDVVHELWFADEYPARAAISSEPFAFDDVAAMRVSATTAEYRETREDEPNFLAPGHLPFLIPPSSEKVPVGAAAELQEEPMPDNEITAESQVSRIFDWRAGFNAVHLITVGLRVGLFTALAEAPGTATELADRLGLDRHSTDVWCTTAYGLQLLDVEPGPRYRLAPFYDQILADPSHPRYLGGYVRLGTEVAAQDFDRLAAAMRSGETRPFQGRGQQFSAVVAEATWGLQPVTARRILPRLPGLAEALDTGGAVLEVGCGTGNLLVALASAFPAARFIGVDLDPDSLQVAAGRVSDAGLGERIELCQGTVDAAARERTVDAVVLVEVLHEIAPDGRADVLTQCAAALRPGGWMVIVDETYPSTLDEARQPEFRFPLMTGFEELRWGNVVPTRQQQDELLRRAGLTGPVDRSTIGEGFTVLSTRKPAE